MVVMVEETSNKAAQKKELQPNLGTNLTPGPVRSVKLEFPYLGNGRLIIHLVNDK